MKKTGIACFFGLVVLVLSTLPSSVSAVVLNEYGDMFQKILENLRTNYWSTDGDWQGDMSFDAAVAAPRILYPYGLDEGDQDLIDKANRTVDRNFDMILKVLGGDSSDLIEALIGSPSGVDAIQYYSGEKYRSFPLTILAWSILTLSDGFIKEVPNPMGDYAGYIFELGTYAYTSTYYASVVKGLPGFTVFNNASGAIELADQRYWTTDTGNGNECGYYYDNDPQHHPFDNRMDSWANGPMLAELAMAYGVTHNNEYLSKATKVLGCFDAYLWDRNRGGYGADLDDPSIKGLSDNNAFLRGLLDLYYVTGNLAFLNRAREILDFIERDMLIEDNQNPGYFICAHDWKPSFGPSKDFCTGCNFFQLENIYRLNKLVENGPICPSPISVCGTFPNQSPPVRDWIVYITVLFSPVLWIRLGLRKLPRVPT